MSNQEFIPVYLITGFLESGKTTLISGMLADEDFTRRSAGGKQKTLVIVCEEGMEEYDEEALSKSGVSVVYSCPSMSGYALVILRPPPAL